MKIKPLIFVSFLFVSKLLFCCTETRPCDKGIQLSMLLSKHLDQTRTRCVTPVDQLVNISGEMKKLECDQFINESLMLKYAHYLCTQYDVRYGMGSDVDTANQDTVTLNYIKGLDLLSQLVIPKSQGSSYIDEFEQYLYRLNIDGISLEKRKQELREIIINIELFPIDKYKLQQDNIKKNLKDCLIKDKSFPTKLYPNRADMCSYILVYMYFELKKLNKDSILDSFLYSQFCLLEGHRYLVIDTVKKIYNEQEDFSEYIKLLYSFSLRNNNPINIKKNKLLCMSKVQESDKVKSSSLHSYNELSYLLSWIKNGDFFKNKHIEYIIYRNIARSYKDFKEYREAIPYYEHALSCEFDVSTAMDLSRCYCLNQYGREDKYNKALEVFLKAKNYPHLEPEEKKELRKHHQHYLELLELTGRQEEYERELTAHNKESIESRLNQNKRWVALFKKAQKLEVLEEKQNLQRELDRETNRLKMLSLSKKKEVEDTDEYIVSTPFIENSKKEYDRETVEKEKTRGVADPSYVIEEVVAAPLVKKPLVRIEDMISGNPLKIFRKLFGPFEKCPVMDDKQVIHPDDVATLMKALNFPYSFFGGKGDHTKGIILSKDDEGNIEEHMIIIPYRVPGIHPHYIRSLREIFIGIGFYPEDLEESLYKAGLLK